MSVINSKHIKNILKNGNANSLCKYLVLSPDIVENSIFNKEYTSFSIRKKSGGKRNIEMPANTLMVVQKAFSKFLTASYNLILTKSAHGFVANSERRKSRNIISNAQKHVGKKFVYNIDIANFFPSINAAMIKNSLMACPLAANEEIASFIALLSTHNWHLPVGSPTSPALSNFVLYDLDLKIEDWAKNNDIIYSRYADDLSFSKNTLFSEEDKKDIAAFIESAGFLINQRKIRTRASHQAQWVTGIKVNEKLNVDRKRVKKIRAMLYDWKTNGLESAAKRFSETNISTQRSFIENIKGNIIFITSIRGKDDEAVVKKFRNEYIFLMQRDFPLDDICPF